MITPEQLANLDNQLQAVEHWLKEAKKTVVECQNCSPPATAGELRQLHFRLDMADKDRRIAALCLLNIKDIIAPKEKAAASQAL